MVHLDASGNQVHKDGMNRTTVAQARLVDFIGQNTRLQGWVRTRRDSKAGFSFIEINDGSCQGNIQIIADNTLENYESEIKHLTTGCSITVEGEVKESGGRGQATEVQASSVQVLSLIHISEPTRPY